MDLYKYLKGILKWWWLMLICTAIAGAISYVVTSRQPRIYSTATTLLVGKVFDNTNPTAGDFFTTERLAESYAQIALRQPILQATIDSLGLSTSWQGLKGQVYVQQVPRTNLLEVAVSDTDPERAVAIADEIAHQLILQSPSSPENQQRRQRGGFVRTQLDDLERRIDVAEASITELETQLSEAISARQIQDLEAEIGSLNTLINDWQSNYGELLRFLEGTDNANFLAIIEPAQRPYVPISPNVGTNVTLAAAVGFSLALGAAFLLVFIDDTIKAPDDMTDALGIPVLGSVNRMQGSDYQDKLITTLGTFSPEAEAYRMLRSNIQFMGVDQIAKSILITSATPGAGKSTTSSNLAVIMAQANLKTVLIDADLRRPVLHKVFDVPNTSGLSDLLHMRGAAVEDYLQRTSVKNLLLLTSGPIPPNPSEMLGSKQMTQLLRRLESFADIIIFDTPPALAVSDASVLSNKVDGVVLVAKSGDTRRNVASQTIKNLDQVGANIMGGVLNAMPRRKGADYYYYQYSPQNGASPAKPSVKPVKEAAPEGRFSFRKRNGHHS